MLTSDREFITIAELAKVTGLTDRCIRNHIAKGYLAGDKVDGAWRFDEEQLGAYLQHPAVKPSIIARKNSIVYDFILDTYKKQPQVCFVLDMPDLEEAGRAAEFFLAEMNTEKYRGVLYSFSNLDGMPRVILSGDAQAALALIAKYHVQA